MTTNTLPGVHPGLPVYRDNLDTIIGMVHIKDVFNILATGEVSLNVCMGRGRGIHETEADKITSPPGVLKSCQNM